VWIEMMAIASGDVQHLHSTGEMCDLGEEAVKIV